MLVELLWNSNSMLVLQSNPPRPSIILLYWRTPCHWSLNTQITYIGCHSQIFTLFYSLQLIFLPRPTRNPLCAHIMTSWGKLVVCRVVVVWSEVMAACPKYEVWLWWGDSIIGVTNVSLSFHIALTNLKISVQRIASLLKEKVWCSLYQAATNSLNQL